VARAAHYISSDELLTTFQAQLPQCAAREEPHMTSSPALPVATRDIQPDYPPVRERIIYALGYLFCHLIATLIIVAFCGVIVPQYLLFFEVKEVELPAPTMSLIQFAQLIRSAPALFVPITLLIDGLILFRLQSLPRQLRVLTIWWFAGYLIVALLVLYSGCVALALPISALTNTPGV
jgi:hypothetical protein